MTIFIQILLAVVILTLTTLVTFAGFQVFHILNDFRQVLSKFNKILDNTQALSESSAKPILAVNEFFSDVKSLVAETQDEIISTTPDRVISPRHTDQKEHISHRFFRRSGSPLRPS
jgi:hypothetical protein